MQFPKNVLFFKNFGIFGNAFTVGYRAFPTNFEPNLCSCFPAIFKDSSWIFCRSKGDVVGKLKCKKSGRMIEIAIPKTRTKIAAEVVTQLSRYSNSINSEEM